VVDLKFGAVEDPINSMFGGEFENGLVGLENNFSFSRNMSHTSVISEKFILMSIIDNVEEGGLVSELDVFILYSNSVGRLNSNR